MDIESIVEYKVNEINKLKNKNKYSIKKIAIGIGALSLILSLGSIWFLLINIFSLIIKKYFLKDTEFEYIVYEFESSNQIKVYSGDRSITLYNDRNDMDELIKFTEFIDEPLEITNITTGYHSRMTESYSKRKIDKMVSDQQRQSDMNRHIYETIKRTKLVAEINEVIQLNQKLYYKSDASFKDYIYSITNMKYVYNTLKLETKDPMIIHVPFDELTDGYSGSGQHLRRFHKFITEYNSYILAFGVTQANIEIDSIYKEYLETKNYDEYDSTFGITNSSMIISSSAQIPTTNSMQMPTYLPDNSRIFLYE